MLRANSKVRVSVNGSGYETLLTSVADPDPDPHVFGPPGSGSGSFNH
jgi:hypothetical protein